MHIVERGILLATLTALTALTALVLHSKYTLPYTAPYTAPYTSPSHDDLVIVTAHYNEDLTWLKRQDEFPVVVCDKHGSEATPFTPDARCSLQINRGREASSFLKFIIEYYDDLPRHIAFVHGHEFAEHQTLPFGILEGIRRAKKHDFDYINLNARLQFNHLYDAPESIESVAATHWFSHPGHKFLRKYWDSHFADILGCDFPEHLGYVCCAQFVVSRRAIRRHPKESYIRLYELVMDPTKGTDYEAAVAIEFIWHILFGETSNRWSAGAHGNETSSASYVSSRFN